MCARADLVAVVSEVESSPSTRFILGSGAEHGNNQHKFTDRILQPKLWLEGANALAPFK